MKINKIKYHFLIRLIVGIVFLTSAVLKLVSIDSFEVYIYSLEILNLDSSFLLARVVISIELFSGLLLLLGIYLKKITLASIIMLGVFSLFISYLLFTPNSEHCHCFGEAIELSHPATLLKNIILIILLLLVYKKEETKIKHGKVLLILTVCISLSIPLIISPPDNFYYKKYAKKIDYNEALLIDYINQNKQLAAGKKMICFFSTNCEFCKLASKKITGISNKLESQNNINVVFLETQNSVDAFYKESNSTAFDYYFLSTEKFLRITKGKMPLIVVANNGKIISKYGYRTINESEIIGFMKQAD